MNTLRIRSMLHRLSIGIVIMILGSGCTPSLGGRSLPPTPLPNVRAQDLLLDTQAFPRRWEVFPCEPNCNYRETHAIRSFGIVDVAGHVIQDVFRLPSIAAAEKKFQAYQETTFGTPPPEIAYHSPIADDYYVGCGIDRVPQCRANLRYGNYFIYFYFNIDRGNGEGLKITEVEPILRAIDQRVASVLHIPLPTAPLTPVQ